MRVVGDGLRRGGRLGGWILKLPMHQFEYLEKGCLGTREREREIKGAVFWQVLTLFPTTLQNIYTFSHNIYFFSKYTVETYPVFG